GRGNPRYRRPGPSALHDQSRAAGGPGRASPLWGGPHLPREPVLPLASDFWHLRPAAPLARHARELAAASRLLGADLRDGRSLPGRSAVLPVLVRSVPGLLDGLRGGGAARLLLPAGRGHEQRCPPPLSARQRRYRRLLHADVRPAPRRGGPIRR